MTTDVTQLEINPTFQILERERERDITHIYRFLG